MEKLVLAYIDGKKQSIFKNLFGKEPQFVKYLRTWGESGTVKIKKKISPKLADQGIPCIFVGYTKDHEGDCYDILHPPSRTIFFFLLYTGLLDLITCAE